MNHNNLEDKMFVEACAKTFDANLTTVFEGDSYFRSSDFTFTYNKHFILVFDRVNKESLDQIRSILADFPSYFAHIISAQELENYPLHGLWQFAFRKPILGSYDKALADLSKHTILAGIQSSMVQVSHLVRKHFLEMESTWSILWGARFSDWIQKVTDFGIIRLWNYYETGSYPAHHEVILDSSHSTRPVQQVLEYQNNGNTLRDRVLLMPSELNKFLLTINEVIEYYAELIVDQPTIRYSRQDIYFREERKSSTHSELVKVFSHALGSKLKMLLLSGSQARNEAELDSDIDTIAVLETVDSALLQQLKEALKELPKLTSYVISVNGFLSYPAYRRHTFLYGTQYLAGTLSLGGPLSTSDLIEGIKHTLIVILQISREYYIRGSYSRRAIRSVRWQAKMVDFGCLRLLPLLDSGRYLTSRAEVREYFRMDREAMYLLNILDNTDEWQRKVYNDFKNGRYLSIEEVLLTVNSFAQRHLQYLRRVE